MDVKHISISGLPVGATPSGKAPDGYGEFVTVDRLAALELERTRDTIVNKRPELLVEGIRLLSAKWELDALMEKLRADTHSALGGDSVKGAFDLYADEARKARAVVIPPGTGKSSKK